MNFLKKIFRRKVWAKCGHSTFVTDEVFAFGCIATTKLPIKNYVTNYCHRCLETMAIQCAWCGKAIFIGDPVTLYTPTKDFSVPTYAVTYSTDPFRLVGCLRDDCVSTIADRKGFWYPPGQVVRVPSLIETALNTGASIVAMRNVNKFPKS